MILNLVDSTILALPRAPASNMLNVRWHFGTLLSTSLPPQMGNGSLQLMRIIAPQRDIAVLCDNLNKSLPLLRRHFAQGGGIEVYGAKEPVVNAGTSGPYGVISPGGGGLTLQHGSGSPSVNVGPGFAINASGDPIKVGGGGSGSNIGGRVVTVGGSRGITVGQGSTTTVGGSQTITVGSGSTTVGGGQTITVGSGSTITVGGSRGITVGQGYNTNIGGSPTLIAGSVYNTNVGGSRGSPVGQGYNTNVGGSQTLTAGSVYNTNVGGSLPPDLARAVRGALCLLFRL